MFLVVVCLALLAGVQQEDTARHAVRPPRAFVRGPGDVPSALPETGAVPLSAPAIDSLVRTHPGLRPLLLREFLVPSHPLPDFAPPGDRDRFAAYMRKYGPVSRFQRMAQIAGRHREVLDIPLHPAIQDYQVDILATLHWLLGLSP